MLFHDKLLAVHDIDALLQSLYLTIGAYQSAVDGVHGGSAVGLTHYHIVYACGHIGHQVVRT